ncbi:MAG: CARDB domain-containing protein [archaeon]
MANKLFYSYTKYYNIPGISLGIAISDQKRAKSPVSDNPRNHVLLGEGCAKSSAWKQKHPGAALFFYLFTLIAIILQAVLCSAQGQIALDKSQYGVGETVKIKLMNASQDFALNIISDNDVFRYSGELKAEMDFYPTKEGQYTVRLNDPGNNILLDEKTFSVSYDYTISKPALLYTDKKEYLLDEAVQIFVNTSSGGESAAEQELRIVSDKESLKYLGAIDSPISFLPRYAGAYQLKLINRFVPVATAEFLVLNQSINEAAAEIPEQPETQATDNRSFEKNQTETGMVGIGVLDQQSTAQKQQDVGLGAIVIDDQLLLAEDQELELQAPRGLNITLPFRLELRARRGATANEDIRNSISILRAEGTRYDVEYLPRKANIKSIVFNNLKLDSDRSFDFDEVTLKKEESKKELRDKKIVKSFFIDTAQLNYTNGTITAIALGKELWKCKEWNSTREICLGNWTKVQDLTPGKEYEIIITPEDPAYAETGVASINTKKPIYHPNETAEMIMVVLNTKGRLVSNAQVTLSITAPDSTTTTLTTASQGIKESSRGIYEAAYSKTGLEGEYSMFVTATGWNVNYSMQSSFEVREFYEFDIIRDTPVTIDPWQGPFQSRIQLMPYINVTSYDFTEILPSEFVVTDSGGAQQRTINNQTFLTWTNLSSVETVGYEANAPLITPNLYALGRSFITYFAQGTNMLFTEARNWFLAIDPLQNLFFDDFESWGCRTTGAPIAGNNCLYSANWGQFTNCNTPSTARFCTSDDGKEGNHTANSYAIQMTNWVMDSSAGLWFTLDPSIYDDINVNGYIYGASLDNVREYCAIWARDSNSIAPIYNCTNTICTGTDTTPQTDLYIYFNINLSSLSGINLSESNISVHIGGAHSNTADYCFFDRINITGIAYPPNITNLTNPPNNTVTNLTTIQFNFTVNATKDLVLPNCTLWTDMNGSWMENSTIYNVSRNSITNITLADLPDGTFKWNVICYTRTGLYDWYDSNYTLTIDARPPIKTITSIDKDTSEPWNTTNRNPVINITLNKNGTCRLSTTDSNFTSIPSYYNCTGAKTANISCTYTGTQLNIGTNYLYVICNDTSGHNDNTTSNLDITFEVLCDAHSDCDSTSYCDYTQYCHSDELAGYPCNTQAHTGLAWNDVCGNGINRYCVNDSSYSYTGWYCTGSATDCVYNDQGKSYALGETLCISGVNDYRNCSNSNLWSSQVDCAEQFDAHNQSATYHPGLYCGYYGTDQSCVNGTSGGCSGASTACNPYIYNQTITACGSTLEECDWGCGAGCDAGNSTAPGIASGTCYYNKNCNINCLWSQSSEGAPSFCINDNDGGSCAYSNRTDPTTSDTCYWNASCQNTVGATLNNNSILMADYCDYCNQYGNQTGQYSPAPNTSCSSNCANSGTIYYDSGGTPADRSNDCSNGITIMLGDTLTLGDIWNGSAPAQCDAAECNLDCGTMIGTCSAGICNCTDQDNPQLILIWPDNLTWTNNASVQFRYNVTDISSQIKNCSLIINNVVNRTNTSINKSVAEQRFIANMTNGTSNWSIRCYDNSSSFNLNQSETRILGIDTTIPPLLNPRINGTNFTINKNICLNITANDTYSGIKDIIATIIPPGQPAENITLYDNATTSCDGANGNGVYSAVYALIFSGTYNWSSAYAIDDANNQNLTYPNLRWNVTTGGIVNVSMNYPTANIKINESEYNYFYVQNCTAACSNSGSSNCTDVTVSIEYYLAGSYETINTTTTDLISNKTSYSCGNVTRGSNCTTTFNVTAGPGNKSWPVRCRADGVNSATAFSISRNVTINDHPTAGILYPISSQWLKGITYINASISFDSDGLIINYTFSYDNNTAFSSPSMICNGTSNNCTWNTTAQNQCQNNSMSCYLRVTVTDNDRLTNSTYIIVGFDTQGPTTIIGNPQNFTNITTSQYTVNATVTDNEIGTINLVIFEYRENSTASWKQACNDSDRTAPYECSWNTTSLLDGKTYEVRAYSTDGLNNTGAADTRTNITIDRNGPTINLERPSNNSYNTGNQTFYFNVTDIASNINNCSIMLDGSINQTTYNPQQNISLNFTINDNTVGSHTWRIDCTDGVGNVNSSETRTFTVDLTGPVTILNRPPAADPKMYGIYIVNASATDSGVGNISTVAFEYRENSTAEWISICNATQGPAYNCSLDTTALADGTTYEVRAYATDILNNTGSPSVRYSVTIDNNGPAIDGLSPDPGSIDNDGNVTFSYLVDDIGSGVANCSLMINGSINQTSFAVPEGSEQYFYLYNQNDTTLNWSIKCWDDFTAQPHMAQTNPRTLYILILYVLKSNVTTDKKTYETGNQQSDSINITTTTIDYSNQSIEASAITDIIKTSGESRNIWWNTTWRYRLRNTLTETSNKTRKDQWVHLSFMLDPDCSNLAHKNSLRLIQDPGTNVGFNQWNITYCTDTNYIKSLWVSFRLNLTANSNTNIYLYYDNASTITKTSKDQGPMRMIWVSAGGTGNAPLQNTIKTDLNSALSALGLDPGTFYDNLNTTAASADFTLTNMQNYSIVYYDSAAKYSSSWYTTEANAMFQFVNQSGNLFLTGQELGYQANADGWLYNGVFTNLTHASAGYVDNANPTTFTVAANHPTTKYLGMGTTVSVAGDYEDGYTTLAGSTSVRILNWTGSATPTAGTANDGLNDPSCTGFCGKTVYYSGLFYISATQGIQNVTARSRLLQGTIEWFLNNSLAESRGQQEQWIARNTTDTTGAQGLWSWIHPAASMNGSYQAVSQASKTKYNDATNWTGFNVTMDRTPPNITLNGPQNESEANSSVTFSYYVNDTLSTVLNCTLFIDGNKEDSDPTIQEGVIQYFYPRIPTGGWHNWSVNCTDYYGNIGASETWTVFIKPPDLTVTSSGIAFNNTTPREGDNITIIATVHNTGGSDAENVKMQFYLRDPDTDGVQINGNFTANITDINGAQPNATFNVSWVTTGPGPFSIYVIVDPPTATNGTIFESNETNNKAYNTLNVPAYNQFYGLVKNNVYLSDENNNSLFYYLNITNVTGNIFAIDGRSTVDFSALQSMGRDINNNTAANDFNDTDTALNMTSYNDSIRRTYTAGTDTPLTTKTFTFYTKTTQNTPIINSTNTTSFVTGILWDTSDGGTQYNGTQDIAFITEISQNKTGSYGTYDYEIKVPVNLKNYEGPGSSVALYWEIKEP